MFKWQNKEALWIDKIIGEEEMREGVHSLSDECAP